MMPVTVTENRKSHHNTKVRNRIRKTAGQVFRAAGYENASIDTLMAAADLTRGAFYAHFRSKSELFASVIRDDHLLLSALRQRKGNDNKTLWAEMREIFSDYLSPDSLPLTYTSCTFASLSETAARGDIAMRNGFEKAFNAVLAEMVRGQKISITHPNMVAALSTAIGAVSTASACSDPKVQTIILNASHDVFRRLTSSARLEAEHTGSRHDVHDGHIRVLE